MVVANAVAGLAEISQTCGKDLLDLDRGEHPQAAGAMAIWIAHGLSELNVAGGNVGPL